MTTLTITHPTGIIKGTIRLPGSKSISNRALILQKISDANVSVVNLSEADDTILMQQALAKTTGRIHLKNAGTCMRFLTAYFAATEHSDITLLCDERMQQRPIDELVNALQQMGADITYLNQAGFPPLHIRGKKLSGGRITMSASASSQYTSALMMIGPQCTNDLIINLTGRVTSLPYISMTARMMEQFGIEVKINMKPTVSIQVNASTHLASLPNQIFTVEPDWSGASYWFEIAALSRECNLLLEGLYGDSLQGDSIIAKIMEPFGVKSANEPGGIRLTKSKTNNPQKTLDLADRPDLAPAIAVSSAALSIPLELTGLQNLAIKESNRLLALHTELSKTGFKIASTDHSLVIKEHPSSSLVLNPHISTYGDHRIAMAFAPLALVLECVNIEHPSVVEKSYPHFWQDLESVGFEMKS